MLGIVLKAMIPRHELGNQLLITIGFGENGFLFKQKIK
jgi:hypothetical protein